MSLQVWLPLNGSLKNLGLDNIIFFQNTGATLDGNGKIGKCYSFDASNDWIQYDIDKTKYGNKPISYSYWFKCDQTDAGGAILDLAADLCAGYTYSSSGIKFTYWRCWSNSGTRTGDSGTTSTFYDATKWHHIAVIFNANINLIYVDGVLALTEDKSSKYTTYWTPLLGTSYNKFSIGKSAGDSNWIGGKVNDVRIYDHALSAKEVIEIAKGLILHYKLDSIGNRNGNPNLGNTSANYSNQLLENPYTASGWGGDAGTITYYMSGGYNNLPYKVYHKIATGSGGIYRKTDNDIIIEAGKTYTFSCWIKSSRNYTESAYGFNINRGSDNYYINYGASLVLTTDWKFFSKTFTATTDQAGAYGEMSIIYDDNVTDYYVYYSGFKIEEGTEATPWVNPIDNNLSIIYDSSGYGNNGLMNEITLSNTSSRYNQNSIFNGSNSYIKVTENNWMPLHTRELTINLWAKTATWPTSGRIFSCTETGGFNTEAGNSGYWRFPIYVCTNEALTSYAYKYDSKEILISALPTNQWTMLTFVYDSTGTKTYINGELHHIYNNISYGIHFNMNARLFLGCEANTASPTSPYFNGEESDFRIYVTALTAELILELYNTSATIDNTGNIYARELVEI